MKKTKIIATIGPVTSNKKSLISLYKNGINVIRFNFSHSNYEQALQLIKMIKELNGQGLTNLSLLLDTKGPEIRTGEVSNPIQIKSGKKYKIFVDKKLTKENDIFCDYPYLIEDCKIGQKIIIDSGLLQTTVTNKTKKYIEILAHNSIQLTSKRHINLPGVVLKLPGITSQDKKDIQFALENGFDFIAASFIRNKKGITEIRKLFKKYNNEYIKLISKIENQEAIENLDEIIENSDGIMVARGDLGIEIPLEKLPVYQHKMVKKCKENGKFVIIATHLLETMIQNPFPTRAEISDIFNSVLEQPDSLMLSGETTIGKFPVESAKIMTKIIEEAEQNIEYSHKNYTNKGLTPRDIEKKLLISSGIEIGQELGAKALIIVTKSGRLAKLASLFRPKIPVFAFTPNYESVRIMNLYYGIEPIFLEKWEKDNYLETMDQAVEYLFNKKIIPKNSVVIAINDIQRAGKEIPIMEIININDFLLFRKK